MTAPRLTEAQTRALASVRARARDAKAQARSRLEALRPWLLARGHSLESWTDFPRGLPIHVHFHPDRLDGGGRTVARALLEDGLYRSQFETQISNGGLTAVPGGDRDLWEERLFEGAYQVRGVGASERPKYGALSVWGHPDGACPRFGSCYLELRSEVLSRVTIAFGDSVLEPQDLGCLELGESLLAGYLEALQEGQPWPDLPEPEGEVSEKPGRNLDHAFEVQIHGPLRIPEDVARIVLDPCFRRTPFVQAWADRLGPDRIHWHRGFRLEWGRIPASFRGPRCLEVERWIRGRTKGESFSARELGDAARDLVQTPELSDRFGGPRESLQRIKELWHALVALGNYG